MPDSQQGHGAIQRAGVFCELPAVLAGLGCDAAPVFAGTGVDPVRLTPDTRVPMLVMQDILHRAVLATGCPHLGLLVGQRFTLAIHGVIGRLMATAPTLRRALVDYATWQPGYSSGAIVYLVDLGGAAAFGFGVYAPVSPGLRVMYDAVAAVGLRIVQLLLDGTGQPEEIHLSRDVPLDPSPYLRHFRVPVLFNQDQTCLILDNRTLDLPLPRHDPEARQIARADVTGMMRQAMPGTSAQVRIALRRVLLTGPPLLEAVAAEVGLHPRTLRRRLAAEGTTFEALRDEMRFAIAKEFLAMTDLPVGEISAALGYASPGVFSEAFRKWSDTAPVLWRRDMRAL